MELSKLSDSELKSYARKLSFDIAKYHNYQLTKKIQLNSAYGAMGSEYFRFFDIRLATAVTCSGQLVIQWLAQDINQYLNTLLKTENVDYIIAMDTDSLYIDVNKIVKLIFKELPEDKNKVINALDKFAEDKLQKVIDKSCLNLKEYLNAYSQKMVMKRESIADKGLWTAKKRYILHVYDSEGVRYEQPKLKIQGIEAIKSSTPEVCRKKIKEAIKIIITKNQEDLHTYIKEFKKEFKTLKPEIVAFPRGCNGLSDYHDSYAIFKKGTPMHVRGALVYNKMLKDYKLEKQYPCIEDGDKIKFLYLKEPNPTRGHVLAMTDSGLPQEFEIEKYVNYDLQFEKTFLDPLRIILNAIGWTTEKQHTLDDIFGD